MPTSRLNPDRLPKLTHHKASSKGVVRLNGRDHYCGPFGTPECQATYLRIVSEWLANGRREPDPKEAAPASGDVTINEMLLAFRHWADGYYRKNGEPTGEATVIRYAVQPLREMFGDTMAAEFGPKKLKAVRQQMVDSGLCRNECNRRTRIIVRAFKWAGGGGLD